MERAKNNLSIGRASLFLATILCVACGGGGANDGASDALEPTLPNISLSESRPGGEATRSNFSDDAFSLAPRAIERSFADDANFKAGNQLFRTKQAGLGPVVNSSTCQSCHIKDGRGQVPLNAAEPMQSMLMAINHDPIYGRQLQTLTPTSFESGDINAGLAHFDQGLVRLTGEARVAIRYEPLVERYDDGTELELRKPTYIFSELAYGAFAPATSFSPRVAPQMIGLGLLGAISEDQIRAGADVDDLDDDGISGRAVTQVSGAALGRFGLKASTKSILQQSAGAYQNDLGITNSLFPNESCTDTQTTCKDAELLELNAHPNGVDISDFELALVEFYSRLLAVPANRAYDAANNTWDEHFVRGRALFYEVGCHGCHQPSWQTAQAKGSELGGLDIGGLNGAAEPIATLSNQKIWPYTDMLLHDMGGSCEPLRASDVQGQSCESGENCSYELSCSGLADGFDTATASAQEWRTPPLWGIGLAQTVNPRASFLHDGRARTIEEAVLWHGGEAKAAQQGFKALTAEQRADLLFFLESI